MSRLLDDRRSSAHAAAWRDEVDRVEQFSAVFTLIAPRFLISAVRAYASDIAVGEKTRIGLTIQLFDRFFKNQSVFIEFREYILGDLGMFLCRRSPKRSNAMLNQR